MTTGDEKTPNAVTQPQTNVVLLPPKFEEPQVPQNKAIAFVRRHPVATVVGGLAVGALAATLIPRRNRAYVARQGSMLTDAITAASLAVAQQALASIDATSSTVRERAHSLAARAEHAGEAAYGRAQALLGRNPAPATLVDRIAARANEIAGRLRG